MSRLIEPNLSLMVLGMVVNDSRIDRGLNLHLLKAMVPVAFIG